MTRVLRYEVPVDDRVHEMVVAGRVLHVAARRSDLVELWCQGEFGRGERTVRLLVVGTGQLWPDDARHLGTAISPGGTLVWHLLDVP